MTKCTLNHILAGRQNLLATEVVLPASCEQICQQRTWSGCMLFPIIGMTMSHKSCHSLWTWLTVLQSSSLMREQQPSSPVVQTGQPQCKIL